MRDQHYDALKGIREELHARRVAWERDLHRLEEDAAVHKAHIASLASRINALDEAIHQRRGQP